MSSPVTSWRRAAKSNQAINKLYTLLSGSPTANDKELAQAAAELSKLVLAPIAGSLNKRRIIVVPDGGLHYVPFQLLSTSANINEPLLASFEIVNVPSASILGQLREERQHRRPGTNVLAAFGDPVFASNYAQFKDASAGELMAAANAQERRRGNTPCAISKWKQINSIQTIFNRCYTPSMS